jgi:3',5'-cyclic AMP phosphodiesterase CpdA
VKSSEVTRIVLTIGLTAFLLNSSAESPAQIAPQPSSANLRMAFISDTQTPLWIESLFLGNDRNEEATDSLFAGICRTRPAALFMLGDLVSFGAYGRAWDAMDIDIRAVRAEQIPVFATPGNHELMVWSRTGESNFAERFPAYVRTGYCVRIDSVAVVLLNSNFGTLDENEKTNQIFWYKRMLDSLDRDTGTVCIIVCCHHSPFTNSTVVAPSEEVRQQFVPPFLRSAKCRLFLSGHAHAFEHFKEQGKDFMVIGGGGGSRHPLRTGTESESIDHSPQGKPLFHYITLEWRETSIQVNIHRLLDDFRCVDEKYSADIRESRSGNTK